MRRALPILCLAAALSGCKVGPNYSRPVVPAPPQFRAGESQPTEASLGTAKWFDVFQDEALRELIRESVVANYDIRIAAQRVLAAQSQVTVVKSPLFPTAGAGASSNGFGIDSPVQRTHGGGLGVSWEPDLFGRVRRATEAARADLASLEENRNGILQTLVAQVAASYFELLEYDAELEYVRESIATRQQSVRLVTAREEGGVASTLEVDQAKTLVASAQAQVALLEKAQEQTENLINFLMGKHPGPVKRGNALTNQAEPPQIPSGLPSSLLDRRPDLREAEQKLVAANARVGVAKAAFYPSISLTVAGGYQSNDLLSVVNRAGGAWTRAASIDIPIFDMGRRMGNYKIAQAQREELLISYQKSINSAFQDVSNALIGYQKNKEHTTAQLVLAETLRNQSRTANNRYVGGVSSYLEVLDTERQRLTAEQELAQAQRSVLTSLVTLYKALGGGWQ
jgi:NodT family efflux transporter outer membrane factor (OMF) lipoprotein